MTLLEKLNSRTATFAVVGLGYVGLPLAVEMANAGVKVIGFDVSEPKIEALYRKESYIPDVDQAELAAHIESGLFVPTSDFARAAEADCIAICVPTPLNTMREPDLSFVEGAAASIAPFITAETLVTLESTTYPGTTDEVVRPILETQGHTVGEDIYLAYSPERVDPGNPRYLTKNTPKVVGADDEKSLRVAQAFYNTYLDEIVTVSSTRAAEMTKLLENTFRSVNIALVNELAMLAKRMDVNIWEVIDAAKTKPFGFMPFYPGPGLGGHCIPVDPFYLSWKAREFNFRTEFIDLSGKINENMPNYVIDRLMAVLNTQGKALSNSKVLILGIAYKGDIDDLRESPAIAIIRMLEPVTGELVYHDTYIPHYDEDGIKLESSELTAELVQSADVVLVLTKHKNVDYDMVAENAQLIFDTRNAFKDSKLEKIHTL